MDDISTVLPATDLRFIAACENGDLEAVRDLAGQISDINMRDQRGRTGLMIAASRNRTAIMSFLLDHGAGVNERNKRGTTALMFAKTAAFAYGDCSGMKILLDAGADRDARDSHGLTALDYTIQRAEMVKEFLKTYDPGVSA